MSLVTIDGAQYNIKSASKRATLPTGQAATSVLYLNTTPANAWELQLETSAPIIPMMFGIYAFDPVSGSNKSEYIYYLYNISDTAYTTIYPLFDSWFGLFSQNLDQVNANPNHPGRGFPLDQWKPYSYMFQEVNSAYRINWELNSRIVAGLAPPTTAVTAAGNAQDLCQIFTYLELGS